MKARLPLWIAAFWWVSLSCVGFLVVPMLFAYLPTPALAGGMAARLFAAQTWVSTVCAFLLLMQTGSNRGTTVDASAHGALIFIVSGMLLALLSEYAIAPRIVLKENLRLWHSVGSVMYLLQWGCAAVTFWKLSASRKALPS